MHIIKKENLKSRIHIDHTPIINEIERSIKFYNWDFILSSLPSGSFLVGGYIRDLILGRLNSVMALDVDIVVPKNAIEIGKSVCNEANNWSDEETSLFSVQNILLKNNINVKKEDRIIPILRFQSIYELCPENINFLEGIFGNNE